MKRRLLGMLLGAWLLAPAAQAQAVEGRRYSPGPFDAIEIAGSADIRFRQGAVDEVFIEGGGELQDMGLSVRNGVLRLDSSGGWKFWNSRRMQVSVTARQLSRLTISGSAMLHASGPVNAERLVISISGAGLARFDRLEAEQLSFNASGAGDAEVAGRVGELRLSISGRSEFRGENLMSGRARVSISGVGNVKVWATEELSISVAGVGRVEYWGTPEVRRSESGASTVIDRGPKRAPP